MSPGNGADMQICTEEIDDLVDRSIIMVIGRGGHTVYLQHALTKQAVPLPGAIGLPHDAAEGICKALRHHFAGLLQAAMNSPLP